MRAHLQDTPPEIEKKVTDYEYLQVWAAELGVSDLLKKSFADTNFNPSINTTPDDHTA
jgi:hypothetical protein